jgi:Glycosyl transferase family 2
MKLVMTLLVRNEADIVEANIEYHLAQGVDFVIATDHGSEDGTCEILREYERIGVAKVIRDEGEGHHQSNRVTKMAEIARLGYNADWVIHNDADEFWWPIVGNLRDVFTSIPLRYGQIEVERRNFRPHTDSRDDFYSRLIHREATSLDLAGDRLAPKIAHRPHPQVVVAPGNHSITGGDLVPVPASEMLEIFHFPMRSYEQFERKVVQIGLGYEQVPDRSLNVGRDQLALLELQRSGKLREYYDGLIVEGDALERGLQMGTLVIDRRLDDFMSALRSTGQQRIRPDAPFARALLHRTMSALSEVEQGREELESLRAKNELANTRIDELQANITDLKASLEDTRGTVRSTTGQLQSTTRELEKTSQALHLLRTSRLLRSTAWARRLYYRVRASR